MSESSNICERCADIACFEFSTKITECQDFVPKTNADRIRSMTDEELAEMLCSGTCKYCHSYNKDCDILEWLRKEVE